MSSLDGVPIRTLMIADYPKTIGDVKAWIQMVGFLGDNTPLVEGVLAVDAHLDHVEAIECLECQGTDLLGTMHSCTTR